MKEISETQVRILVQLKLSEGMPNKYVHAESVYFGHMGQSILGLTLAIAAHE